MDNAVRSDTKYRDIADGNRKESPAGIDIFRLSDTKYRDIADGNPGGGPIVHL